MGKQIKKYKKIFSIFLALVIIVTTCLPFPFSVKVKAAAEQEIYKDETCRISFKVNSEWESGMEAQFIIENLGNQVLEGWQFQITFPHEIANIWDGEIKSKKGDIYVIQHTSYNVNIPVGGKVVVGFTGKKNGKLQVPTDCSLLGGKNEVSEEDYTITYCVTSDWKDAFNGEISITNNTAEKIEGWQLEFDFVCNVTNFWTAKLVSHEGVHYNIKNDDWNSVIKAGETIRLGFEAKPVSGTKGAEEEPYNFKLTALSSDDIIEETDEEEEDNYIYDFSDEELAIDTDKDGIPDCYEKEVLKTDPNNADTDGDGLPDGYEWLYLEDSDPLVKDSDKDADGDGLSNLEEYQLQSDPNTIDTDNDELNDYDEVKKYHTKPNKIDTDGDGIIDSKELILGLDPTKKDTNGNGIEDGKEKIKQSYSKKFDYEESDYRGLNSITIEGEFTNYLEDMMEVRNLYDGDRFATDVVGLVGVPLEIETESEFDKAVVSIAYKSLPTGTSAKDLGIFWFNEEEHRYDKVNSKVDIDKKQITFETSHFSTYLLVDLKKWNAVWDNPISHGDPKKAVDACDVAYVVDVSKSMDNASFKKIQKAMKSLTNTMISGEKGALIGYQISSCKLFQGLTGKTKVLKDAIDAMKPEQKEVKSVGVTSEGIKKGIAQLKKGNSANGKMLFVIGDADISYDKKLVQQAKENRIQIFVVNLNKKAELEQLKKYSKETKGFYYSLENMKHLQSLLFEMKHVVLDGIDTTDADEDGLFDVYETKGMRFLNGKVIKSDPKQKDTDEDGLSDSEEMGYIVWFKKDNAKGNSIKSYGTFFAGISYIKVVDTDGDGIIDALDVNKYSVVQNSKYIKDGNGYSLKFDMNYNWFLASNNIYHHQIAYLSSIMSGLAYYSPSTAQYKIKLKNKSKKYKTYNLEKFMQYVGFSDTKRCYLKDKYKDNHVVQFNYGYKKLKAGEKTKYLVPIIIRGTNAADEWISNFDIGKSGPHKGFNITAKRIIKEVKAYMKKHKINSNNAILWITGHSRGGGVSNLVAKKMIDEKYRVFAYTFAAPAVTQSKTVSNASYKGIFNIINEEDFVPKLPLSKWGFQLYGTKKVKKMTKGMKTSFEKRTGKEYSSLSSKWMKAVINSLENVAAKRSDCFKYTCACHSSSGKKTGKSITIDSTRYFISKQNAEKGKESYKKKLFSELIASCKFKIVKKPVGWKYTVCQTPNFFLFKLAQAMSSIPKFLFSDIADRYEVAKKRIGVASFFIETPHFADSYILLAN